MTTTQIYQIRRNAFAQFSERYRRILRSAFPDTGGISLYVHNWYRCSREDSPEHRTAEALLSAEWDWWHKIEARLNRWSVQAEHRSHASGDYLWCDLCQSGKRR
jgi:hypothetical protein